MVYQPAMKNPQLINVIVDRHCGMQGCPQSGENPTHELPWFCFSHQCTVANCIEPRFGAFRYCRRHIPSCDVRGCENPTDGQRRFCPTHSCKVPGCLSMAPEYQRCDSHYPCSVLGCTRYRRSTVYFCDYHTCGAPHCSQLAEGGQRCKQHLPCSSEDCTRLRAPGKAFCARHNCEIDRCVNEQVSRNRCEEHLACSKEGCGGFQIRDRFGDGMAGYCEKRESQPSCQAPDPRKEKCLTLIQIFHVRRRAARILSIVTSRTSANATNAGSLIARWSAKAVLNSAAVIPAAPAHATSHCPTSRVATRRFVRYMNAERNNARTGPAALRDTATSTAALSKNVQQRGRRCRNFIATATAA